MSARNWRSAILTVARFEGERRLRITTVIAALFSVFGAFYIWVGPQVVAGDVVQEMLDALPAVLNELFGFESLESLEGLLASEYYTLGWIVGLGGYLAYTAAGRVAGDFRGGRMDTLLAAPVARRSVLLGTYLSLLVPIAVLNVVVPLALFGGSVLVGDPLPLVDLVIVHVFSVPYLLCWGSVGILVGVVVRRGRMAGRVALGLVFLAWLFESVITTTDYAWVGAISPTRYFDPPAVLVRGSYDVLGAGMLVLATVTILGFAVRWFSRHDL